MTLAGQAEGPAALLHALGTDAPLCVTESRPMRKPVIAAIESVTAGGVAVRP